MEGDFGKAVVGRLAIFATWKSLSPKTRDGLTRLIGEALADWDQQ